MGKMKTERHPAADAVHAKLIDLLDYWRQKGYSLEKIGDICGVPYTMIHGLLKSPGQPGYKGARLTVNTAVKIWTGLGNALETLLDNCEYVYEESPFKTVDLYQALELEKQTLEFDQKILETAMQKRASQKKTENILKILFAINKTVDVIDKILANNRPVDTHPEKTVSDD